MKYLIAILLALYVIPAYAKRLPTPIVPPVQYNGIQYSAPNDNGRVAYVKASDIHTGNTLWMSTVFRNLINPPLEEDVQWIYISNLQVVQNELLVTDERDRTYHIDLKTGQNTDSQLLLDVAKKGEGIQALLEKKISPNVKDGNGLTPLHLAAMNGHQSAVELLLQYGADINTLDNSGKTPLDLAESAGHERLARFLTSKVGTRSSGSSRILKPSLKFKTLAEFQKEIKEPAVLHDTTNICFFAPKRREKEAQIIFPYLVKAYDALYQIVGTHTKYKMAVYAFPKGNPNGWGGTSECSIEYDDSNLELEKQPEWTQYNVPHVSGYIEEMAHNFVSATMIQFGWSLGIEVSQKVDGNPLLLENIRVTREGQKQTFNQYISNGFVLPKDLPSNQCDRIHAWILYQSSTKYGPSFWTDFFREVRNQRQVLTNASLLDNDDKNRNTRYQITIDCFDKLPGIEFKKRLKDSGISLTTDVKSLRPQSPGWNRRLTE